MYVRWLRVGLRPRLRNEIWTRWLGHRHRNAGSGGRCVRFFHGRVMPMGVARQTARKAEALRGGVPTSRPGRPGPPAAGVEGYRQATPQRTDCIPIGGQPRISFQGRTIKRSNGSDRSDALSRLVCSRTPSELPRHAGASARTDVDHIPAPVCDLEGVCQPVPPCPNPSALPLQVQEPFIELHFRKR